MKDILYGPLFHFKSFALTCILLSISLNSFSLVTIQATAGQPYGIRMTLDSAFDDINNGIYQGDIVIKIQKSFTLTKTAKLNRTNKGNANYNSLTILPSDTATIPINVEFNFVNSIQRYALLLMGVANFKIDGFSPFSNKLNLICFKFNYYYSGSGVSKSSILLLDSGVKNCNIQNCLFQTYNFSNNIDNYSILISTHSSAQSGFYNLTERDSSIYINNNTIIGSYGGISIGGEDLLIPAVELYIYNNSIIDCRYSGIIIFGYCDRIKVKSNSIYHSKNFKATRLSKVVGIISGPNIYQNNNLEFSIESNKIYNLKNDSSVINGMELGSYLQNTIQNSFLIKYFVVNNSISLLDSNSTINYDNTSSSNRNITGLLVYGTNLNLKLINNTIHVGGVSLYSCNNYCWTNSYVFAIDAQKSSKYRISNNLFINDRVGCSTALNWIWRQYDTIFNVNSLVDNNSYFSIFNYSYFNCGLFVFNINNYSKVFPDLKTFQNYLYPQHAHSTFYHALFSDSINSYLSPSVWGNYNLAGVPDPDVTTDIDGNPRDPRFPYKGCSEPPVPITYRDVEAHALLTPSINNFPCGNANTVQCRIKNTGNKTQTFSTTNPLTIYTRLYRPSGTYTTTSTTITSGSLAMDDSMDITLAASLNYDTVGTFTLRNWIYLASDSVALNDTFTDFVQTVVYEYSLPFKEDFTSNNAYTTYWNNSGFTWSSSGGYNNTASVSAAMSNNSNAQIIFPKIKGITANTRLRFVYKLTDGLNAVSPLSTDTFRLMYSIDCGQSFQLLRILRAGDYLVQNNWVNVDVPLSAYIGKVVQFKISISRSNSNTLSYFILDNVRVLEVNGDVQIQQINKPCTAININGILLPTFKMSNGGNSNITFAKLIYQINGPGLNITDSVLWTGTLTPGNNTTVNANGQYVFTTGNYNCKAWISLTSDPDHYNDTNQISLYSYDNNYGDSSLQALQLTPNWGVSQMAGSNFAMGSAASLSLWLKPTAIQSGHIIGKDSLSFSIQMDNAGYIIFSTRNANGTLVNAISGQALLLNTWAHISASYDGQWMRLYINGQQVAVAAQSGSILSQANTQLNLGKLTIANTGVMNGVSALIDEVRIWNSVRIPILMRQDMHLRMDNNSQSNLLVYWRMDEPIGSGVLSDASGNCNSIMYPPAATPSLSGSQIPLTPSVVYFNQQYISSSNTFGTLGLSQTRSNYSGVDTVVCFKILKTPSGNSLPLGHAMPGQYYLYYNYGNGSQSQQTSTFTLNANSFKNAANLNDFTLFRRGAAESGNWTAIINGASSIDTINKTVTFTSTTAIPTNSQLAIGIKYQSTPVTWLSFTAQAQHKDVHLQWETVNEINNKGFYILESNNAEALRARAFVPADDYSLPAAVQAIHESPQRYTYTHANALSDGQTHYYQLKQIDNDGQYSLSKIIAIQPTQLINEDNVIVYPNPFNENLIIETNTNETQHVQLIGMDGRVWMETEIKQRAELKTEELPEGVYVLRVSEQAIKVLK